jgi:hypothetical protein
MGGGAMITAILVLTVLILSGIVAWLFYSTLKIGGSVEREKDQEPSRTARRMRAELFVETYKHRKRDGK